MSNTPSGARRLADKNIDYSQGLNRRLGLFHSVALGFGAVSPVIGIYSTLGLGLALGGASWLWVLPIALAGNCLLLYVYGELAKQFPIAGGAYQWGRRLIGPRYAWFAGWFAICGLLASFCTLAYLGSPWILSLLSIEATPLRLVITAAAFNLGCAACCLRGVDLVKRLLTYGVMAEFIASVLVGFSLLLFFRERPISVLWDFDSFSQTGVASGTVFLALMAVAGWAFVGFDAVISGAEETKNSKRSVPRALWIAMLSVGAVVFLNATAISLAHPDLSWVTSGKDLDPVTTSVTTSFGGWSEKPFVATVVIAFVACGFTCNMVGSRFLWSMSRDGVLPGSSYLRRVSTGTRVPSHAIVATGVLSSVGLLLALNDRAFGTLVTYGTGGLYLTFSLTAAAALAGRLSGKWVPHGTARRQRFGLLVNIAALAWLVFETINIWWPRAELNPPGAAWYQVWAAPLGSGAVLLLGLLYFVTFRPADKLIAALEETADLGPAREGDEDESPAPSVVPATEA